MILSNPDAILTNPDAILLNPVGILTLPLSGLTETLAQTHLLPGPLLGCFLLLFFSFLLVLLAELVFGAWLAKAHFLAFVASFMV